MAINRNSNEEEMQLTLISNRNKSWVSYERMFRDQTLTDVVINCTDGHLKAHKLVLSAWSHYFRDIFVSNADHSCHISYVFIKDIPFKDMKLLIELMYCGRASLSTTQLQSIKKSAEALRIIDCNQLLIPLEDNRDVNNVNNSETHDYNHRRSEPQTDRHLNESQVNEELMDSTPTNLNSEQVFSFDDSFDKSSELSDNNHLSETNTTQTTANSQNGKTLNQSIVEMNSIDPKEAQSEGTNTKNSNQIELSPNSKSDKNVLQMTRLRATANQKRHSSGDNNNNNNDSCDSKVIITQFNPNEVLTDSEEYNRNTGSKAITTTLERVTESHIRQAADVRIEDQLRLHLRSPSLITKTLLSNNPIKQNTSKHYNTEPDYVYNLMSNSMAYRPSSASISDPSSSTFMYISDPNVQKTDSNVSSQLNPMNVTSSTRSSLSRIPTHSFRGVGSQKKSMTRKTATKLSVNKKKRILIYKCNKCTKAYSSQQILSDHFKIVHQHLSDNYACKICGKVVKWRDSLRGHFKSNHPEVESYLDMIQVLS